MRFSYCIIFSVLSLFSVFSAFSSFGYLRHMMQHQPFPYVFAFQADAK